MVFLKPSLLSYGPSHPLSAFQILVPKEIIFFFLTPIFLGAGVQEACRTLDWVTICPQILLFIPRILDTRTHCLKVLFVFSCWPTYGLFDHFYNFVIMGCNGLGCLNVTVIAFYCSYPNSSKREEWTRKKISKEASLCSPTCYSRPGWVQGLV